MPTSHRAIIFDLDGTLVDSLDDIADALNSALAQRRREPACVADVRGWVGDGITTLCRRAAPGADASEVVALHAHFTDAYERCCLARSQLYPGVRATLDALSAAHIPMAVLSNKRDDFTCRIVAGLCDAHWFRAVRGVRHETERKPSPTLAIELCRLMDVAAADALFVGDGLPDMQVARAAGMTSVAVTWGFSDIDELRGERPDHVIDRIEQVMALVG